jgi:hypothetical protein
LQMAQAGTPYARGGSVARAMRHVQRPLDTGKNIPESPQTLQLQQQQLIGGLRPAQMFPLGTPELPLPEGMRRLETPRGVFHYNPFVISASDVQKAANSGRENEILGLGPHSKADVETVARQTGEPPMVLTERAPNGAEVKGSLTVPSLARDQGAAIEASKTPGNSVSVEPLGQVLSDRTNHASGGSVSSPIDRALRVAHGYADGGNVDEDGYYAGLAKDYASQPESTASDIASEDLAKTFLKEATGIPGVVRGAGNVDRGIRESDPIRTLGGVGQAALGAMPGASMTKAGIGAIGPLFSTAPRAAATIAATTVPIAHADDAEAAQTNQQKAIDNNPEVKALRDQLDAARALRTKASLAPGKAYPSTRARELAIETADKTVEEIKEALARATSSVIDDYNTNAPFRERNPGMAQAIMAGGLGVAGGIPLVKGMVDAGYNALSRVPGIHKAAKNVTTAFESANPATVAQTQDVLRRKIGNYDAANGPLATARTMGGSALKGALAGGEASALPEQIDYVNYSPGQGPHDKAAALFKEPNYYMERIGPALQGAGTGILGASIPKIIPKAGLEEARELAARGAPPSFVDRLLARIGGKEAVSPSIGDIDQAKTYLNAATRGSSGRSLGVEPTAQRISGEPLGLEAPRSGYTKRLPDERTLPAPGIDRGLESDALLSRPSGDPPLFRKQDYSQSSQSRQPNAPLNLSDGEIVPGAHGEITRSYVRQVLEDERSLPQSARRPLEDILTSPSRQKAVAASLNAEFKAAGLPPIEEGELIRRIQGTAQEFGALSGSKAGRYADIDNTHSRITGKGHTLALPLAAGLAGAASDGSEGDPSTDISPASDRESAIDRALRASGQYASGGGVHPGNVAKPINKAIALAQGHNPMTGPIHGVTPGRADHIATSVPAGSHILPADLVSGLGQGNTNAGMHVLHKMFKASKLTRKFASGGSAEPIDVLLSDGEYAIHPDVVAEIGGGNMQHGHDILDHWILSERARNIEELKNLPPPAKD